MLLTKNQFRDRYEEGRLHLAFIGPSNAGKTFRTMQMAEKMGFVTLSIDDEIGKELGVKGVANLSQWMGQPHDLQFPSNQTTYLRLEESLTRQATPPESANFILDTTGSAIYLSSPLKNWLKRTFLVVYARVTQAQESAWLESFLKSPKPLVWGDLYRPRAGETRQDTLRRCGAKMLAWRHKRYDELADVTLHEFNASSISGSEFWDLLRDALT